MMNAANSVTGVSNHRIAFSPHSVGWFLLLVIAGGFLSFLQHTLLGRTVPIEVALRALLVLQIVFLLLLGRTRMQPLPGLTSLAITIFGLSAVTSFGISLVLGNDPVRAAQAFYFMFNVGIFLLALPLLPLQFTTGFWLKAFLVLCLGFGALQVLAQDLLLPTALRFEFGLAFDRFINGKLRAVSFFASAPRFAECLVFLSCYVLHRLVAGERRAAIFWIAVYGLCLWLLYNTYSRSGYVLWIASLLIQVLLMRRTIFRRGSSAPVVAALAVLACFAAFLVITLNNSGPRSLYIVDTTSFVARLQHWANVGGGIGEFSFTNLLFGSGQAAMFSRFSNEYYVVDNVFLEQVSYAGLFGLAAFLFLFFEVLRIGSRAASTWEDLNLTPLLAFYAALLFEGLTVDNHNTVFLTQFAILTMLGRLDGRSSFSGVPRRDQYAMARPTGDAGRR